LKDGFPVWLQLGPWATEKTMYGDWSVATKQESMKNVPAFAWWWRITMFPLQLLSK
jgi:hypothetical protein